MSGVLSWSTRITLVCYEWSIELEDKDYTVCYEWSIEVRHNDYTGVL